MRPRPALVSLVIGVLALAGCHGHLDGWRPSSTDVLGSWTSSSCGAEVNLASDGTSTAQNLRRDDGPAVSGPGTWQLAESSEEVIELFVVVGKTAVILDPLQRDNQPILLNILGDPGENNMCEFVRMSSAA